MAEQTPFTTLLSEAPEELLVRLSSGQKINVYEGAASGLHHVSVGPIGNSLTIATTPSAEAAAWLEMVLRYVVRRASPLSREAFRQMMLDRYLRALQDRPAAVVQQYVENDLAALESDRKDKAGEGDHDWSEAEAIYYAETILDQMSACADG